MVENVVETVERYLDAQTERDAARATVACVNEMLARKRCPTPGSLHRLICEYPLGAFGYRTAISALEALSSAHVARQWRQPLEALKRDMVARQQRAEDTMAAMRAEANGAPKCRCDGCCRLANSSGMCDTCERNPRCAVKHEGAS